MKDTLAVLLLIALPCIISCGQATPPRATAAPSAAATVTVTGAPTAPSEPLATRAKALNSAPLGLEIGYANLAGVKAKLGANVQLKDAGLNDYSGGVMLTSSGDGTGIEGISNLVLIFDKQDILAGVVMTLPKNPTEMLKTLSAKYRVDDNQIDTFMNFGNARLSKGDSVIEIGSEHLAFTMEVRYLTTQLLKDFQKQSAQNAEQKRQEQTSKL